MTDISTDRNILLLKHNNSEFLLSVFMLLPPRDCVLFIVVDVVGIELT